MVNKVQIQKILRSLMDEASACIQKNRIQSAVTLYRSAIRLDPRIPQLHNNLGSLLRELGKVEESLESFKTAIKLKPDYASAHSNLLFLLQNFPDQNLETLLNAHKNWAKQQLVSEQRKVEVVCNYRHSNPIVVGLVSPDFYFHPVSVFILPWLEKRDKNNFKVIVYSDRANEDAMSLTIRQNVDKWRGVAGKTDEEVALEIKNDQVNVLIDLAGHTAGNRLKLFARRVASLQISWIGYSATTGVPAMDAVFMDEYIAPEGYEDFFTEKLIRLDGLRFCYTPPMYAPAVSSLPASKNGYLTFGSFNNLAKLTNQVIQTWATILMSLPGSRLILKWKSLSDHEVDQDIKLKFQSHGVTPDRVECRGWSKHAAMLSEYSDVDVALDPFPFSGGLTSCDALYMGIPVITLPSELPISRQTFSFLLALELKEFVAKDLAEYINIALNVASNTKLLERTRGSLRNRVIKSRLCDAKSFALSVEKHIRKSLMQISKQ